MILYRYILKNHLTPFLFSNVTLMCIFLLQFMMKFADRLVGKGLDTFVIIQLIIYNLAWMVVLVVPMASLVATLMAFGTMSQNNEVTILRSSGVSLYRMMVAPIIASLVVGYLLIMFNNDVLPDANFKAKVLMGDISRQKPTLSLEPGVFSQEVSNYAILIRGADKNSNKIFNVTIYDYTIPLKMNVVTAKEGLIYFSQDQSKLIMDLKEGEIHEQDAGRTKLYRKLVFDKHIISMPADQFSFQQTSPVGGRSDREMSTEDMLDIVDSLEVIKKGYVKTFLTDVDVHFFGDEHIDSMSVIYRPDVRGFSPQRLQDKIRNSKNIVISSGKRVEYIQGEINKYMVEVHKKYSIPAACFIFVLLGAPLGVMVRKGGFGVAASISLFFFLIYWAFLIGGEKLADRDFLSPFWGMWAANFMLFFIGVFITLRTVKESVTIDFSFYKRFIPKSWRQETTEDQIQQ